MKKAPKKAIFLSIAPVCSFTFENARLFFAKLPRNFVNTSLSAATPGTLQWLEWCRIEASVANNHEAEYSACGEYKQVQLSTIHYNVSGAVQREGNEGRLYT